MGITQRIYTPAAMVYHYLTAWNSGGEGIHSPYLFEWVRMVLTDKNAYYCWPSIEKKAHRHTLSKDADEPKQREAQVLFRLVNWLGSKERRALNILLWGVGHGIASAYMASVCSKNHLCVIEPDRNKSSAACQLWQLLGISNCHCSQDYDKSAFLSIDVCVFSVTRPDATTLFENILTRVHDKSVVIVMGLRSDFESMQKWHQICQNDKVTSSMDYGRMGIVFFDSHYIHKHYKLRI